MGSNQSLTASDRVSHGLALLHSERPTGKNQFISWSHISLCLEDRNRILGEMWTDCARSMRKPSEIQTQKGPVESCRTSIGQADRHDCQARSDGLQPTSDGLQADESDGLPVERPVGPACRTPSVSNKVRPSNFHFGHWRLDKR